MPKFITAKDIAKAHRLSYQIVNRYTDAGLLDVAFKKSAVRYYKEADVRSRLARVKALVKEGYSLFAVRKSIIGI